MTPKFKSGGRRKRGVGSTTIANISVLVFGSVSGILLARSLGPALRGQFAVIQMLVALAAAISSLGMGEAVAYFASKENESYQRRSVLRSAKVVAIFGTSGTLLICSIALIAVWRRLDTSHLQAVLLALAYVPFFTFNMIAQGWQRGCDRLIEWNVSRVVPTLAWAVGCLALLVSEASLVMAALVLFLSGVVACLVLATRLKLGPRGGRSVRFPVRTLLGYGLPSMISNVPRMFNLRLDQVFIVGLVGAREAGFYVAAVAWVAPVVAIGSAYAMSQFHVIARSVEETRWALIRKIGFMTFKRSLLVGALLAASTPLGFVLVFGSEFSSGAVIALGLIPVSILHALLVACTHMLKAVGKTVSLLVADLLALSVTIGVLLLFSPLIGVWAAVVASGCSYFVAVGYSLRQMSTAPGAV